MKLGQQVDDHLAFALRVCVVPHNFLSRSTCPLGPLVLGELFCGKRCAGLAKRHNPSGRAIVSNAPIAVVRQGMKPIPGVKNW